MSRDEHDTNSDRRTFLRGSVVAGASAAAVITATPVAAAIPESEIVEDTASMDDKYKLSPHVLKYYQTLAN